MSELVTLRLNDDTAAWLKATAKRAGRSINEIGSSLIEEGRRMREFPDIEFRSFSGERLACLKGGIRLWKIVMVAQDYGMDISGLASHFAGVYSETQLQAALNYYAAYPDEIDRFVDECRAMTFDKLKRLLPQARQVTVSE
jgi:uncharacterized protein (DUF433 family)